MELIATQLDDERIDMNDKLVDQLQLNNGDGGKVNKLENKVKNLKMDLVQLRNNETQNFKGLQTCQQDNQAMSADINQMKIIDDRNRQLEGSVKSLNKKCEQYSEHIRGLKDSHNQFIANKNIVNHSIDSLSKSI